MTETLVLNKVAYVQKWTETTIFQSCIIIIIIISTIREELISLSINYLRNNH